MSARSAAVVVALSVACLGVGCGGVDIDTVGPARLMESEEGLIESARAMIFTFSSFVDPAAPADQPQKSTCAYLVDASAAELQTQLELEPGDPSIQRVPLLRGRVDPDRQAQPEFVDAEVAHTFGQVPTGKPLALLALAVDEDPTAEFDVAGLAGHIFAIGCRDLTLEPGKRVAVPLVLVPTGMR